jgi:sodium transport system ATP-binding protein
MSVLRIEHVTKEFKLTLRQRQKQKTNAKTLVAVNDLSFEAVPGVIYGLLGPNGAGKTTTLRMIASLIKPKTGAIYLDNKEINEDIYAYRKKIGFLTSELKLDGFLTPADTITYMGKLYGMSDEEINARKGILFKSFGVDKFQNTPIKDLSTGMKQKVSLAISLCHDPEVIIFDEPTNGLDVIAARDVEEYLINLKKENKIIIISTHIFSLVEKLCDHVGIIISGKLIKDAPLKEIQKEGTLEEVFFKLYEEANINA